MHTVDDENPDGIVRTAEGVPTLLFEFVHTVLNFTLENGVDVRVCDTV